MGFPHTNFGSLVQVLYGLEEGIARGLWLESSPTDSKGNKTLGGQRLEDVDAISSEVMRPPKRYQAGPRHDTDHYSALRHAIKDLINQGLVNLGQPSVTTNPLPTHSTHTVSPPPGDIHHINLIEDDNIHMLSWDDGLPKPIVPTPFNLIPDGMSFQLTHSTHLVIRHQDTFVSFTLWPKDDDSEGRDIQIMTHSGRIAQPPPLAFRPFEGATSHEEVRREDDKVLRQLQSNRARISIWSLLASSSTHRDALIQALSQIRVETTTTLKRLIHMMTADRATCIVFLDDDLLSEVIAYDSTKMEVMGTLVIDLLIAIPFSLHQEMKFIHDGDFEALSFNQHSSTVVLDMMRNISFLPGMGLGLRKQGPSEFIAASDHDTTFGLGFIPIEIEIHHLFHQLQLSNGAPGTSVSTTITLPSPDRVSLLSLCFPDEVTDDGVVVDPIEMIDGVAPHDEHQDEMDMMTVKEEIQKQLSVGFISMVKYPEWLANVVPVPKKDGKVRVCVDFRDLNKANPKDDFPLPHIDLLVDSTIGIKVDPDKIRAILDMPVLRIEKNIKDFLGRS
ncbi:hypothetical protein AAG906_021595 [Vitis piasezkii]